MVNRINCADNYISRMELKCSSIGNNQKKKKIKISYLRFGNSMKDDDVNYIVIWRGV